MATSSQGTTVVPTTSLSPLSGDDKSQPPPNISKAVRDVVSLILNDQQQIYANQQNDLVKMVELHKKLTGKDPLSGSVEIRSPTSNPNVSPSFTSLNTKLSTATAPVTTKPTQVPPKKNDKFQKRRLKLQKFFNQNTVLSEQEVKAIFSVLEKENEKETDEIREIAVNGFLSQLKLQPSSVSQ